jgi:hypothetical protein
MMTRTAGLAGQQQARPDHNAACTRNSGSVVAHGVSAVGTEGWPAIWMETPLCRMFINML